MIAWYFTKYFLLIIKIKKNNLTVSWSLTNMPYSNNGVFNPSRTIPRGPYLQYKYNEKQLKNLIDSQVSGNFNRNLEGKIEYVRQDTATSTNQERTSHIDKKKENFIEQCNENIHATKKGTFSLKRTRKNPGELESCEICRQDKNNFKSPNVCGGVCFDRIRNKCEPNFIYLKDVIKTKASESLNDILFYIQ